MTASRHSRLVIGAELVMVVALFLTGSTPRDSSKHSADSGHGKVLGTHAHTVTISGDLPRSIEPGSIVPLNLSLHNPNDFAISIQKITVTVREVDAPRADADHLCSAVDFTVRQIKGRAVLTLAPESVDDFNGMKLPRGQWPTIGMLNRPVNQDGCKGAFLTLGYSATGSEMN